MGVKNFFKILLNKTKIILAASTIICSQAIPIASVSATAPANPALYASIEIGGGATAITDANGNTNTVTVTFPHGTITASGTNLYSDSNYTIYALGDLTITASPASNYTADLRENGNLIGNNTKTYNNLTAGSRHRIDGEFSLATTKSTINYTPTAEAADIFINGIMLEPGSNTIEYAYDNSGNVDLTLETFATMNKITAVTINNTDYSNQLPSTKEQLLNLVDGQTIHYNFQVPYAATYNITTTTERFTSETSIVGSFLWSYKDEDKDNDDYFGNGTFELVKVVYKGREYTEADLSPDRGFMQWGEVPGENFGGALLPVGAEVTVRMIPNVGYQLTSFTINGGEFETGNEVGVYTFTVPGGNFHLGAHFSRVDNAVAVNTNTVTSGTITIRNGEINNGTVRLDVENATNLTVGDITGFEETAGNYDVKTILDITLYQTIFKGSLADSWDTQIDELRNDATITLELDENVDGNEIIIVHQKHDGSYEIIPTTYDPVTHTITFKTSSFSNYAIASRTVTSPNTGVFTSEEASVTNTLPIISMVVAIFSLATLMFKKSKE